MIAFFDFDNTLIHGDAGPLFGRYMLESRYAHVKRKHGRRAAHRDRARLLARYTPYIIRLSLQAALYKARAVRRSSLVRSAYRTLRGVPAKPYYSLMDDFVAAEIPARAYPDMVKEIENHLEAGRQCVVVTTGAQALVEKCIHAFPGPIEILGCTLEEKDGRLTGRVRGPLYGADKANIVQAYCRAAGVDPAECHAYTDHYSDYHMLEAVGHPVVVNPRGRLLELADARGWRIMRPAPPAASEERA